MSEPRNKVLGSFSASAIFSASKSKKTNKMSSLDKKSDSRLTPENSALLLVDHQTGLCSGVANHSQPEFLNSVLALAHIGKVFGLPTVISTSFSEGPNVPLISEVAEIFPDIPIVHRPGEINAWDNPDFVASVKATNRKNLIIAGVSTEVCVAFLRALRRERRLWCVCGDRRIGDMECACGQCCGHSDGAGGRGASHLARSRRRAGKRLASSAGQPLAKAMANHLPFYSCVTGGFLAHQGEKSQ